MILDEKHTEDEKRELHIEEIKAYLYDKVNNSK